MPNGGVTRDTFKHADINSQLSILYDQQLEIIRSMDKLRIHDTDQCSRCAERWIDCDKRFKVIETNWYKIAGALVLLGAVTPLVTKIIIKLWIGQA